MRHRPWRELHTVVIALGLLGSAREARAQPCPAETGGFSQQAVLTMKTADNSCTIPDGGYAKVNTQLRLHVQSQVGGWCQTYFRNPQGLCQQQTFYNRLAANSSLRMDATVVGPVYGNLNVQNYNTCSVVGGQCTLVNTISQGRTWLAHQSYGLGPHVYTSVNLTGGGTIGSGAQYCNMALYQFPENNPITVNVVACAPNFDEPTAFPDLINRLEPSMIEIFLPAGLSGLSGPLTTAVSLWNDVLGGAGEPVLTVTSVACTAGPTCVTINAADLGVDEQGNPPCAATGGNYNTSTGYLSSQIVITVDNDWYQAGESRLRRTLAHEIGHLLGLDHPAPCTGPDSVMTTGAYACNATGAVPDSPTLTDTTPVERTSYGGGTKVSCGF